MKPLALVAVHVYVPYVVMSAVSVSEAWLLRVIPFGFVCGPISLKKLMLEYWVMIFFLRIYIKLILKSI